MCEEVEYLCVAGARGELLPGCRGVRNWEENGRVRSRVVRFERAGFVAVVMT